MTPRELYEAGDLSQAVTTSIELVRKKPTDVEARSFLVQLLCHQGELERADKQLETIGQQAEAAIGVALLRQLVRAEQARQQLFREGRLPEFINEPPEYIELHLKAVLAVQAGDKTEAAKLLVQAEEQRPHLKGVCDGVEFDDFRDLDDLTAGFIETLTSNGKYYWIPLENIELLEFNKPESSLDLLWRRVHMTVTDGPDGQVFVPALYSQTERSGNDKLQLGRGTDWEEDASGLVMGLGQRMYLVGDQERSVMELERIEIQAGNVEN